MRQSHHPARRHYCRRGACFASGASMGCPRDLYRYDGREIRLAVHEHWGHADRPTMKLLPMSWGSSCVGSVIVKLADNFPTSVG